MEPDQGSSEPITVQIPTDRAKAWEFLHKLATDEAFYREVEENPGLLLAEQGLVVGNLAPPECIKLPPRWQIEDLLSRADDPFKDGAKPPLGFAVYMMAIAWAGPAPPDGRPPAGRPGERPGDAPDGQPDDE